MYKKLILMAMAVAMVVTGCAIRKVDAGTNSEDKAVTYNFATYNVGVFNKSGVNSAEMVAKMMGEWKLDAISLNELDSCNTRSGIGVYQLEAFAKLMGGWNINFASAIQFRGGTYGIGVAVPYEILDRWTVRLPKEDDKEVRALSVVETEKFVFCSTHLGLTDAAQLSQVDAINAFVEKHFKGYGKPVLLAGDFNATPESETISRLSGRWQILSSTDSYTYSTSKPSKCIDYILAYRHAVGCTVKETKVGTLFRNGDPAIASDHFPVFVSVEF